jgi:hypothetical protein
MRASRSAVMPRDLGGQRGSRDKSQKRAFASRYDVQRDEVRSLEFSVWIRVEEDTQQDRKEGGGG